MTAKVSIERRSVLSRCFPGSQSTKEYVFRRSGIGHMTKWGQFFSDDSNQTARSAPLTSHSIPVSFEEMGVLKTFNLRPDQRYCSLQNGESSRFRSEERHILRQIQRPVVMQSFAARKTPPPRKQA